MNEIEINPELSCEEQREQFETRFREAIKQSIPYENSLSVRMLNDMLDTFKNLCYNEGIEAGFRIGNNFRNL